MHVHNPNSGPEQAPRRTTRGSLARGLEIFPTADLGIRLLDVFARAKTDTNAGTNTGTNTEGKWLSARRIEDHLPCRPRR